MTPLLISAIIIISSMIMVYFFAQWKRDNSIVDVFWGIGFCFIAICMFILKGESTPRQWIVLVMVLLWGIRLAVYISRRNNGKGEDFRYANWRKEWGNTQWWRSFFQVFLLQGVIMWLVSIPVVLVLSQANSPLMVIDFIGILVWVTGYFFEVVSDRQLARFKMDPGNKGRIIQSGLWQYSRHPNYFGEITMWWGIFLVTLQVNGWYWAIISPVLITWLIVRVSGIPMLEKKYSDNPEFRAYAEKVPALIPRFWQ
jgi:steroid 5-alpha reductase family enzyme